MGGEEIKNMFIIILAILVIALIVTTIVLGVREANQDKK